MTYYNYYDFMRFLILYSASIVIITTSIIVGSRVDRNCRFEEGRR